MSSKRKASRPTRMVLSKDDGEAPLESLSPSQKENISAIPLNVIDLEDGAEAEISDDGDFQSIPALPKATKKRKNHKKAKKQLLPAPIVSGSPLFHIGFAATELSTPQKFEGFLPVASEGDSLILEQELGKATVKDAMKPIMESVRWLAQKGMLLLRAKCSSSPLVPSSSSASTSYPVEVSVVLTTRAFDDLPRDADDTSERLPHSHLRRVIDHFCNLPSLPFSVASDQPPDQQSVMNVHTLYDEICPSSLAPVLAEVPAELLPTLRRYQLQAVQWMLNRELHPQGEADHPLWTPIQVKNAVDMKADTFYMNRYSGRVSRSTFRGTADEGDLAQTLRGGILADEMGLGKTLEVLALILSHRQNASEEAVDFEGVAPERVECKCGVNTETEGDTWVLCDGCNRWMHSRCVNGVIDSDLPFHCDACLSFADSERVEVGATLIVCPASILQQWKSEITRHTKAHSVRLLIYEGVRSRDCMLRPQMFQSYDIVLTSYETLRGELHHVLENVEQRKLRQQKRYRPLPTPLTRCVWWRVCLDECQMVESPTAKTAEMAQQLHSVYRWSVSGTPIQRGLEDLQGLCVFLGVRPFYKRTWWLRVLQQPFEQGHREPLIQLLKTLMWRNTKRSVGDQLGLPHQTEHLVHLNFSPVEAFFYRKKHQECLTKASDQLSKVTRNGHMTEIQKTARVLGPILQLRQACCHPQIGTKSVRSLNQNPMTMAELLDTLIQRAKVEAQDAHRGLLCALNGLAAIEIIDGAYARAIARYEEAQQMISANEIHFSSDRLQRIHCLYNLAELLSRVELNVDNMYTARIAELKQQELTLRKQYTSDSGARTAIAAEKWRKVEENVAPLLSNAELMSWFQFLILDAKKNKPLAAELMQLATDALSYSRDAVGGIPAGRSLKRFTTVDGLSLVVMGEWEDLVNARTALVQRMNTLSSPITPNDVYISGNCRICRAHLKKTGQTCKHCLAVDVFDDYQAKLFRRVTKLREQSAADAENDDVINPRSDPIEDDAAAEDEHMKYKESRQRATRESTFADSELLRLLKLLRVLVQRRMLNNLPASLADLVDRFDKLLENMKKEYLSLSSLWRAQTYELSALDELDMTTMRLRVAFPGERVADDERNYKLQREDVAPTRMRLETDKMQFGGALTHALTQLSYLKQLKQSNSDGDGGGADSGKRDEIGTCPVCQEAIGPNKVVLLCGHMFCSDCIVSILKHSHSKTNLKCPSCRQLIPQEEISYIVDYGPKNNQISSAASSAGSAEDLSQYSVKGSYGSKIECLIRCLKKITSTDSEAKSIVFSEWKDVLEITAHALRENEIDFVQVKDRSDFDKKLHLFKNNSTVKVLLLSTKNGANGLNLTEATNVLLIAPMLTPSVEEQAVNRIHRIGQTKPTNVYRFFVSHTIEEKVFEFGRTKSQQPPQNLHKAKKAKKNDISIDELQQLISNTMETPLPASAALGADHPPAADVSTELNFWNKKVWYREQWMARHRAVFLIECEYSWECKANGTSIADEVAAETMGRSLAKTVTERLLALRDEDAPNN